MVFSLLNEFKGWGYSLRIQPFPFPSPIFPCLPGNSLVPIFSVPPLYRSNILPYRCQPSPRSWWGNIRRALEPPFILHAALAPVVPSPRRPKGQAAHFLGSLYMWGKDPAPTHFSRMSLWPFPVSGSPRTQLPLSLLKALSVFVSVCKLSLRSVSWASSGSW